MKRRCLNPNATRWEEYGGRGIKVCERWMTFENFLADMGESLPGMTIDRINNDGNYEPTNCRWVPKSVQNTNNRRIVLVEIDGVKLHLREWARRLGVAPTSICKMRRRRGWTTEQAIRYYLPL